MYFVTKFLLLSQLILISVSISKLSNNEFNEDENSRYIKEEGVSSIGNQNSANHFTDTLPRDPSQDYPTYTKIPPTAFSCKGKVNWQYYADTETGCQVFHVCETEYSKISFLCPIGSIFNQRYLVCDWWYNFDCDIAKALYTLNNVVYDGQTFPDEFQGSGVGQRGFDLSPASSEENSVPSHSGRDQPKIPKRQGSI